MKAIVLDAPAGFAHQWIASQKIGTLRIAAAFTSWIFRVIKHECYSLLRRSKRETPLLSAEAHQVDEHRDLQATLASDLVNAIAALEPRYRQVVIMRDVQEMTAPQVAATLGMSRDAVKSRLHRALTQLRVMPKDWGEE